MSSKICTSPDPRTLQNPIVLVPFERPVPPIIPPQVVPRIKRQPEPPEQGPGVSRAAVQIVGGERQPLDPPPVQHAAGQVGPVPLVEQARQLDLVGGEVAGPVVEVADGPEHAGRGEGFFLGHGPGPLPVDHAHDVVGVVDEEVVALVVRVDVDQLPQHLLPLVPAGGIPTQHLPFHLLHQDVAQSDHVPGIRLTGPIMNLGRRDALTVGLEKRQGGRFAPQEIVAHVRRWRRYLLESEARDPLNAVFKGDDGMAVLPAHHARECRR
ncbi:hypothetical protein PG984_011632 [Apiospora sp. TS-2023a]